MKRIKFLFFIFILCITFALSSCSIMLGGIFGAGEKENRLPETNDAAPPVSSITNNITISGGSQNVAYAAASGLRSSVIVRCEYVSASPTIGVGTTYYSAGAGVIYKADDDGGAFIITNFHVVHDSSSATENRISNNIKVYLYGLESSAYAVEAKYVGGSANYDIAVLRVDKSDVFKSALAGGAIAPVTVADSGKVFSGQPTIVIGNPSGSGISVTSGIVSVESEYISMTAADGSTEVSFRVIRTDAPVNSGNSGGGMFNDSGELIGIINAKIIKTDIENIGYAIPSNVARAVADNIIDHCYGKSCESVMRAMLGVTVQSVAFSTRYDEQTGALVRCETVKVVGVSEGSLAYGHMQVGDIINSITVAGKLVDVTRQYHIIDAMLDARTGDTIITKVTRGGAEVSVIIVITEECLVAY